MAYEESQEVENERSKNRQRATRERRAEEKRVKDLRKEALDQSSGTKERREVKAADEGELLSMLGRSSSGGSDKGGIYDISTNNYSQPQRNQSGQDSSIEDAGIDTLGGSGASSDGGDTNTFTLDIVKSDNTAGTATFNGPGINDD
jgi:hypothetical protein